MIFKPGSIERSVSAPVPALFSCPQVNSRIQDESDLFGDVLVENFYESYLNLTIKSLMLVKFAALADVNTDFVFKVS